jgi:hypothetical protein
MGAPIRVPVDPVSRGMLWNTSPSMVHRMRVTSLGLKLFVKGRNIVSVNVDRSGSSGCIVL